MSEATQTSGNPEGAASVWGDPSEESPSNDSFAAWGQPEPTPAPDPAPQWDAPEPATSPDNTWGSEPSHQSWSPADDRPAPQWGAAPGEDNDRSWGEVADPAPQTRRSHRIDTGNYQLSQDTAAPAMPSEHSASELIQNIPEAGEPKARQGWRSWFGLPPGQAELSERRDMAKVQRPLVGAKTVAVINVKGGAGKTPTTLELAGALGSARGGSVVAIDNNELRGTMPLRTLPNGCQENFRTFVDNIEQLRNSMSTAEIQRYMRHQGDGQYDALVCATDARHEVTAEEYNAVHEVLSRVYQLTIVDTGNNEGAANWQAAIESADAIVVPVKRSSSSTCVAASQMLEELQKTYPSLVRNAIVVFTDGRGPVDKQMFERHRKYFSDRARTVVEIPTDPHINAEVPIEHDRLTKATRRAALELAAAVTDVLAEPV